jgi:hypothetical protein
LAGGRIHGLKAKKNFLSFFNITVEYGFPRQNRGIGGKADSLT